ncbi:MAG: FtsW/RodA/SpoVE family cell cycle protein, partial [Actinomycetaceae bacterium]|nr:FtsW/RodA/SpoVE family cell cycle protein [Actinomycetaceae bacterium]
VFFTIFFAGYLVSERDNLSLAGPKFLGITFPKLRHILPLGIAWVVSLGVLAVEHDFGTALLFFGLFVGMLYVATQRVSWMLIGAVLSVGGVYVIRMAVPHVAVRFDVWLRAFDVDVYDRTYGSSWQIVQGIFGMASGGLTGTGLSKGYPHINYAADSDLIIATLGEELGLAGLMAVLMLYFIFVMRGLRTSMRVRDGFGKLLAVGLSFVVALQAFVVVGGVTRVLPMTGLVMPFLARGSSALLVNWMMVGLLIRMSESSRRPANSSASLTEEELEELTRPDRGHTGQMDAVDDSQKNPASFAVPSSRSDFYEETNATQNLQSVSVEGGEHE